MFKSSYSLGRFRGIPLRAHWSILLVIPWVYLHTHSILQATTALFAFGGLMLAHEIGHAIIAKRRGLEVFRIDLFLLHGLCVHEEPYYKEDDVLVAWGGVAAQTVVLIIASVIQWVAPFETWGLQYFWSGVALVLIYTNILIIMLNLLPIAPLDGARAWLFVPDLLKQWRFRLRKRKWFKGRKTKASETEAGKIAAEAIKRMMNQEKDS